MKFLTKQIPFTTSPTKQLLIAVCIGLFLAFILIYLEPFNTDDFKSNHKTFILSVYGFLIFITYLIQGRIENIWYRKTHKKWIIQNEIISIIIFFIVTGSIAYIYNELFVNKNKYVFEYHLEYYKQITFVFIPIFAPLLIFLRNRFGELISPKTLSVIVLKGINKKEILQIQKDDLLFVKASENYIEIYFTIKDIVQHKIFRNTLSEIAKQVPFLEQCHRSYLVNLSKVNEIKGNSQKAFISFNVDGIEIPLSKSSYKKIKKSLSL